MKFDTAHFERVASEVAYKNSTSILDKRTMKAFYGVGPVVMNELWNRCDRPEKTQPKHLVWTLMYIKLYCPDDVMAVICGCAKNTLSKWVGLWIEALAKFSKTVILWENRNRNLPPGVWCKMSVDGTDFAMNEPSPFHKAWMSPKFGGAALKYEVALSIYSGDIVWIHGPHKGSKNDVAVFKEALMSKLEEGEMVEADKGYRMLPVDTRRTPAECESHTEWLEKAHVRARHETVNHRFKVFGILKQQFRKNDRTKHKAIFEAIAGIVQLEISLGHVLFTVTPTTEKKPGQYSTSYITRKKYDEDSI